MVNPAIPTFVKDNGRSAADIDQSAGHLLERLPSFTAAATLAMLLAMTLATAISIRTINQSQSDLRFDELVDSVSLEVDAELSYCFDEPRMLGIFFDLSSYVRNVESYAIGRGFS